MALAAASLRIGPAAQLSPGGGYLGVQKGEPGAEMEGVDRDGGRVGLCQSD